MVKLASLLKMKKFLIPAGIGLVAALSFSHYWMYQKGKETERYASMQQIIEVLEEQKQHLEKVHEKEMNILRERHESEKRILEKASEINIDVDTPECVDLGTDWLFEYNRAIQSPKDP